MVETIEIIETIHKIIRKEVQNNAGLKTVTFELSNKISSLTNHLRTKLKA